MAVAPGVVVWITGLSGAGKSTVGERVAVDLRGMGRAVVWLDGDRLRAILGAADRGFDLESRLALARSYGRLCAELAGQGVDVVCTTVSMFHQVRDWNRQTIPRYFEVYLRVPLEELRRRDPKGHYRHSRDMVGLHHDAEEPLNPDLVIDNHGGNDAATTAAQVIAALRKRIEQ